jgi:hypothetical protein
MSDPNLTPLPDDLAKLFEAEARAHVPDPALVAQIREGVSRTLVLRGGGDGGSQSGGNTGGGAAPSSTGGGGTALLSKAAATKLGILAALGGAAIGGGVGYSAGVHTASSPPAVVATVTPTPSAAVSVPEVMPSASASVPAAPVVSVDSLRSAPTGSVAVRGDLRRERELIDAAGSALRAGNPDEALADADRHAQKFPSGQLAEEREVLAVRALLALGRTTDARARAERARTKFPSASFARTLDAVLGR